MEGRCGTSLFLFSDKWLIGQGLAYLPLFEGAWTIMTFNLCCRLGCSHARDKSDENHVDILTGYISIKKNQSSDILQDIKQGVEVSIKKINLRSCSKDVNNNHPRFYLEA